MGNDLFSINKDGKKVDSHLHEPILNNEGANKYIAHKAIIRAVKDGLPLERAIDLYGHKPKVGK